MERSRTDSGVTVKMPNYGYVKNVRPLWLSRFLGHKWQTISVSVVLAVIPVYTQNWQDLAISAGALLGLMIGPDLDLSYSRLGWFGKLSLADEYTTLVPHRAKISHTPFLGTLVRAPVVFLPLILFLVLPIMAIANGKLGTSLAIPWLVLLKVFSGLCVADTWHIACDWIEGTLKFKRR